MTFDPGGVAAPSIVAGGPAVSLRSTAGYQLESIRDGRKNFWRRQTRPLKVLIDAEPVGRG